jgi:membrane associated rhomboid family serine protease/tetratricopeptide (TPR) repeat protein
MSDSPNITPRSGFVIYRPFRPWATYALIGLNFAVFLLMAGIDASSHPPLRDWALRTFTGVGSDPEFLLRMGASFGPYTRRGEYWRLVMPMFLHIGALHLLMNNYSLLVLGRFLERVYGYARFTFLYVFAGMGSAALSMSMSDKVSAGASGAIFGIAGVMLVTGFLHRQSIPRHWGRAFGKGILPVIVLNLGLGLALRQWVDNWAHFGGLAGGMVLGALIPPLSREVFPSPAVEKLSPVLALPVIVIVLAATAEVNAYRANSEVRRLLVDGDRFHAAHHDDWALQRLQAAAARAPRDEHPHLALGSLYLDEKKWNDAIREESEALRLNPLSPDAQFGLAQAYRQMGYTSKAAEYLQAFQKNIPSDDADAQYQFGSLLYQHQFFAEAIDHYQKALRLKPDMAEAHNDLAWLYATCDDLKYRNPKAALEHARRAVDLTHWQRASVIDTLAEALYADQQFAEAVKVQTRAVQLDPHNRELLEHLARYQKAANSAGKKST